MRVTRRLEVPYPQEEVFDFLADVRNEERWHPDATSVELEGDGPIGPGSKFRVHYRRLGLIELEILEFVRPWQLVFRATGATKAVYQSRLEASDGGTKIVTVADAQARGLGRLLWPLLQGRIQKDFQRRGELLAAGLADHFRATEAQT
jgi:carbon monoxide dehydrogenase subunit G